MLSVYLLTKGTLKLITEQSSVAYYKDALSK